MADFSTVLNAMPKGVIFYRCDMYNLFPSVSASEMEDHLDKAIVSGKVAHLSDGFLVCNSVELYEAQGRIKSLTLVMIKAHLNSVAKTSSWGEIYSKGGNVAGDEEDKNKFLGSVWVLMPKSLRNEALKKSGLNLQSVSAGEVAAIMQTVLTDDDLFNS